MRGQEGHRIGLHSTPVPISQMRAQGLRALARERLNNPWLSHAEDIYVAIRKVILRNNGMGKI